MVAAIPKNRNCVLVKTSSEIALKSTQVRHYFTKKLLGAIKLALKRNNVGWSKILRGGGRLYLFTPQLKKAAKILQRVVGIHAIAFAARYQFRDYTEIEQAVVEEAKHFLKKGDSFALRVRKSVEGGPSRKNYENRLGQAIMDSIPGLKVNLSKPKKQIFIEVRKKDFFLYFSEISCLRGLPIGVEGNVAFLFEGKKCELLAAFLLMYRGCNIFPVVKKKGKKIEGFVNKLVPFNSYRKFILTERKNLQRLIEKREIQAIGTADSSLKEKDLKRYAEFDSKQGISVLRPLLLYPKELMKEKGALFD